MDLVSQTACPRGRGRPLFAESYYLAMISNLAPQGADAISLGFIYISEKGQGAIDVVGVVTSHCGEVIH